MSQETKEQEFFTMDEFVRHDSVTTVTGLQPKSLNLHTVWYYRSHDNKTKAKRMLSTGSSCLCSAYRPKLYSAAPNTEIQSSYTQTQLETIFNNWVWNMFLGGLFVPALQHKF